MTTQRFFTLLLSLAVLTACSGSGGSSGGGAGSGTAVPGSTAALANKTFDQAVFATTHNAFNFDQGPFKFGNQTVSVSQQLTAGIRGLMLDTHPYGGSDPALKDVPYLYHNFWSLGFESYEKVLLEIKAFLDAHPHEVITIILENYCSLDELAKVQSATGIDSYTYAHTPGTPWPTIGDMIARNERLVIFNSDRDSSGTHSWSNYVWDFCCDTDFSNSQLSDFDNKVNRGDPNNSLFILNHFLTLPVIGMGDVGLSDQANEKSVLMQRFDDVYKTGRIPNFYTVDYYERGEVLEAIKEMNALIP